MSDKKIGPVVVDGNNVKQGMVISGLNVDGRLNTVELRALLDKPVCETCQGSGIVDDGELTHSEGGIPYECGPIKCVKDCPDCSKPAAQQQDEVAPILKPFRDLPYGTKFRYQGTQDVWVRTQHNVIAAWSGILKNPIYQSLCCFCHLDGDEDGNTLDTLVEVCEAAQHQGEPVTDDQLIEAARKAALNSTHRYSYMPATQEDASNWVPHRWVVEAMRNVASAEQPAPVVTLSKLMQAIHDVEGFPGVTGVQLLELVARLNGVKP